MGLSPSVTSGTAEQTRRGAGVCVGRKFSGIQWKVIRIVDGPIRSLDEIEELPTGEIGELIVAGPVVTRQYVTRVQANALAKIADGGRCWHRMGDCGYLDANGAFLVLRPGGPSRAHGRRAHVSRPLRGDLQPAPGHSPQCLGRRGARRAATPGHYPRTAPRANARKQEGPRRLAARRFESLRAASPLTEEIADFLLHPGLPVDIRHNAKIFREKLAVWAERKS